MASTILQRIGGHDRIARIVFAFYDRVIDNRRLAGFFDSADMRRIVEHQAKFLVSVLDGPACYDDRELQDIHAGLAIADADFDEMLTMMRQTLDEFAVAAEDLELVLERLRARRRAIVGA